MTFMYTIPANSQNRITFDYDEEAREVLETRIQDGQIFLFANREGMITLSKLLLTIAHGDYTEGFHVHLRKDFNADNPECLAIVFATEPKD
jgi:hypothetical protein